MTRATREALEDVAHILHDAGWDQGAAAAKPTPVGRTKLADLYEPDETAWLEESSRLIRAGQLSELDCENLASYLDDMAKRDRREVNSRLRVLVTHLLKWRYQPEKRSRSWTSTVINKRLELEELLESATLRQHAVDALTKVYPGAVKSAAAQTRLPPSTFPAECPFTLDQILTEELA